MTYDSSLFYSQLPVQSQFEDMFRGNGLQPLPADWHVVLTDVSGSTGAVDRGAYREVVLLGASTIIAAVNMLGTTEVPFAFGGDGAVICVPEQSHSVVMQALRALKDLALERFNMDLRVGSVLARTVYEAGHQILVGRYRCILNSNH